MLGISREASLLIELTGRRYAAPWTPEDWCILWAILRYTRQTLIDGDKRDAEVMLSRVAGSLATPRDPQPSGTPGP